jgi:ParB family chromosome partitioning protein
MATTKTKRAPRKKAAGARKRRGVSLEPTQLTAAELGPVALDGAIGELAAQVTSDGGSVLAAYREPLGGHTQLLVALPLERVAPTPYQRDVSDPPVEEQLSLLHREGQRPAVEAKRRDHPPE